MTRLRVGASAKGHKGRIGRHATREGEEELHVKGKVGASLMASDLFRLTSLPSASDSTCDVEEGEGTYSKFASFQFESQTDATLS